MRQIKNQSRISFLIVFGLIFINSSCHKNVSESDAHVEQFICPKTEKINESDYNKLIYVSESGQDSAGTGTKENPYRSITFALDNVRDASAWDKIAVLVSGGEYSGKTIQLKKFVYMFGGFNDQNWERDIQKFTSILSGGEGRRVLIAADESRIDGFHIVNGKIKGKGAALFCDGTSPVVSNNLFMNNKTLGAANWNPEYWHETANDGGAIFGRNGSSAVIRNNLFVNNKTENGRGAAISFDGHCKPVISQNIFLNNTAGLNDPMRSSDGGAVSIFNRCDATIDRNLFIGNVADSKNDGGAVFIALWSSGNVLGNIFVDNHSGDDAGALFVGGQEHRYNAPLDPIPPKNEFFVSIRNNTFIGNHHGGTNSGAMRFTMESRGEFIGNILAHNNGVYFQRSEVRVADNTILDNFLFIETKDGLKKGIIENNLLWAGYDQQIEAQVNNNNMLFPVIGNGNYSKPPRFVDDGIKLISMSTNFNQRDNSTIITISDFGFTENQLINRVVKAGTKWGVIKSNKLSTITIWGNFMGEVNFTLLPTYTLTM